MSCCTCAPCPLPRRQLLLQRLLVPLRQPRRVLLHSLRDSLVVGPLGRAQLLLQVSLRSDTLHLLCRVVRLELGGVALEVGVALLVLGQPLPVVVVHTLQLHRVPRRSVRVSVLRTDGQAEAAWQGGGRAWQSDRLVRLGFGQTRCALIVCGWAVGVKGGAVVYTVPSFRHGIQQGQFPEPKCEGASGVREVREEGSSPAKVSTA